MIITRQRLVAAGLIVASAVAFAIGAAVEHNASGEGQEPRPAAGAAGDQDSAAVNPPDADNNEGATQSQGESATEPHAEKASEDLFGINPESTGLVAAATVGSILLAAALLAFASPLLAAGVGLVMVAFTALDIREVVHQFGESHSGLATIATFVALLHLLAAGAAIIVARSSRRPHEGIRSAAGVA